MSMIFPRAYDAGSYRDRIDYRKPCTLPLPPEDQAWADELIRHAVATPSE